jgi:Flp pilus assembly protein TadB
MRSRDVRAIAFCGVSAVAVFAVSYLLLGEFVVSAMLLAAYMIFIMTRPRMRRVRSRLRGDPDWSHYIQD